MWIKLVSPRSTMRVLDSAFKSHMAPPLSLLVLGALTPRQHVVTLEDENVERLRLDDRPDLVGITVKVDAAYRAHEISRRYRARGVPVVLGGIHPTVCPDENRAHANSIVIGEGEGVWPDVLRDVGSLKPVYRVEKLSAGLNGSPVPRWELLQGKNYLFTNTLVMSRGCPWRCEFCYGSSPNLPRGHRVKSPAQVLAEIASLATRHVFFIDDNFIGSPDKARTLLSAFSSLGLTWHTAVSADIGRHEDILDLMAQSGCKSLFIGFETLNERNLLACRKPQNRIEEYDRTIRMIHDRGMMVNASLVFGFDQDTTDTFAPTLDWLVSRKVETMTGHILTPFPGTPFYRRLLAEGRIIDSNLAHYNTSHVVFRPRGMTAEELQEGFLWMYRQFYSWRRIWERLPAAREQWAAYLLFNVLYRKLGATVSLLGKLGAMGLLARTARALSYPDLRNDRSELMMIPEPDSLQRAGVRLPHRA
jgi:radical SAM superfamily enzyme YgiQ (UPF0313 family)